MLSCRGRKNVAGLERPWRFAPTQTYNPDTNPSGLISFGLAENAPMRADIANYINEKVIFTTDSVSYRSSASINARLPIATAAHLNRILGAHTPIQPDHVLVADSATSLGNMLGRNLAETGDAILVSRPMYGRFELDYGVEADVEIVYADTTIDEGFTPNVVEKYEIALAEAEERGVRIRAVLVVNPHNPVGRCYPADILKATAQFCAKHSIHLISDEIYASCVFASGDPEAVPFTSILALNLGKIIDPNLVHVLYGFSKDFASGGLHLGFLVTQNKQLRHACKMILRLHSPSQAAITIGTTILEDQDFVSSFTAKSRNSLAAGYRLVTSFLDQEGIEYAKGGNAGFFVYVNFSSFLLKDDSPTQTQEFKLAQKFLDEGVFLHPGEEHGKDVGWFRLVYSHDELTLREGLRRLLGALQRTNR
ncbi:Pyridoxal phosphate-dependent transferase major region subdomain 2 [Penicillium odoratum]|uniref:Pyridoxal phosphate-dependent transferase major region subdomain 2 n=1 Tax=Penicillium odoratum TaxID=1167516 RepID=UPI0025477BA3|nr:Pyridoxal phosphate-dependent transferase major region subdomain 2 [Penicillium odoratum]KAJ5777736.1 Pyridoxal phosphate-dependent transferase major region subdomain 2 [Penicillium odoratum]